MKRFATVGNMRLITSYLEDQLAIPAALQGRLRKHLSDLLFLCYVHQLTTGRLHSEVNAPNARVLVSMPGRAISSCGISVVLVFFSEPNLAEHVTSFRSFISNNWDYNVGTALIVLLRGGLVRWFLEVAHTRKMVPQALSQTVNHGVISLPADSRRFLLDQGYAEAVCKFQGGTLLRYTSSLLGL